MKQLRAEYLSVFGSEPPTHHRQNLYRRIAWEIQAQAEGRRLSEEARQYALKLAADTELNRRIADALKKRRAGEPQHAAQAGPSDAAPAKAPAAEPPATEPAVRGRDPRLPNPESFLIRKHGSKLARVKVLESGFIYERKAYSTLSAVARAITGEHWNGFLFFGLGKKPKA